MGDPANVNKPVICYEFSDFVDAMGWSEDWDKYTLCEAARIVLDRYKVGPICVINVLDKDEATHSTEATNTFDLSALGNPDYVTWEEFGVLLSTVVITDGEVDPTTYTEGDDYTLEFDDDGYLRINILDDGTIPDDSSLEVTADSWDTSAITSSDIVGSYASGVYKGLKVIHQVYPRTGLVPEFVSCPNWNDTYEVMEAMRSEGESVSGDFGCLTVADCAPASGDISDYSAVSTWIGDNNYKKERMALGWAKILYGDSEESHLSSHIIGLSMSADSNHNDVPYASPSNKTLKASAMIFEDTTEIYLTKTQANALNGQGVVTAIHTRSGWKLWGNRTAIYPTNTDPKDAFIVGRRMMNRIRNTIILTSERDVDEPGNKRQIEGVVGTIQRWLDGLIALGALIDGKIAFLEADNSVVDLSDGKVKFRVWVTWPAPMREMEFVVEYDPEALSELF
jgi:phage tail sheath protein FI